MRTSMFIVDHPVSQTLQDYAGEQCEIIDDHGGDEIVLIQLTNWPGKAGQRLVLRRDLIEEQPMLFDETFLFDGIGT